MARYSDADFTDWIDAEIAWRKAEIHNYYLIARKHNSITSRINPVTRAGIPLLYAHWEGFIKECAVEYLEFISRRRLTNAELKDHFVANSLRFSEGLRTNALSFEDLLKIVAFFKSKTENRCQIKSELSINTRSNLKWSVFCEIIDVLGFDISVYSGKETLIDKILVGNRNKIAHGENSLIDFTTYEIVHHEVLALLELFRNQIENAVALKAYKKDAAS